MDRPRLLIADERREGVVSPGVFLAASLKALGVPLQLFVGGFDEEYLRMLSLSCEQEVYSLHPSLFASNAAFRDVFTYLARGDRLNLILAPLGKLASEDHLELDEETLSVARILGIGIIAAPRANPVAVLTSRIMGDVYAQLLRAQIDLYGVVFSSVLNPREYQLLEVGVGRTIPSPILGYIPRYMDRQNVTLEQLCTDPSLVHPVQITANQLQGMVGQVDWSAIAAFGQYAAPLNESMHPIHPLQEAPKVAVLSDQTLASSGGNDLAFFRTIGCSVIDVSLLQGRIPATADILYIPHGLPHLALKRLHLNEDLFDQVRALPQRSLPVLVNGGFSAAWGRWISTPDQGNSGRDVGLNAFDEGFELSEVSREGIPVEIEERPTRTTVVLPLFDDERLRGTLSGYMRGGLNIPGDGQCAWLAKDLRDGKVLGEAGWRVHKLVGSQVCLDLWSCSNVIKRWIRQEAR
ncbi:MAG: hypothetical protein CSA35_07435 [Dethiosulfovibrio peptidovorans]|nr:MAG: hypothetical protein CSA35_07435 [Dethiosulfovibrio peptidovorans]